MGEELSQKVCWITGAGRGIGAATVKRFIERDAFVIASSLSDFSKYIERGVYSDKFYLIENFKYLKCDISNKDDVFETYQKIIADFGKVDILINNAGIGLFKSFRDTSVEDFDKIINTNFRGTFLTTKAVIKDMIERKSGIIVNISSMGVVQNFANCSVYNATKSAMLSLSRSLRNEIRNEGIKILDFIPGPTFTDIWDEPSKEMYKSRMMQPEDIATIIADSVAISIKGRLMVEEIIIRPQLGDI